MRKKINMLLVIILSVLLVAGCSLNNGARVYDDEKMIVENFNTYNLVKSKQSMSDNHLTGSAEKKWRGWALSGNLRLQKIRM